MALHNSEPTKSDPVYTLKYVELLNIFCINLASSLFVDTEQIVVGNCLITSSACDGPVKATNPLI